MNKIILQFVLALGIVAVAQTASAQLSGYGMSPAQCRKFCASGIPPPQGCLPCYLNTGNPLTWNQIRDFDCRRQGGSAQLCAAQRESQDSLNKLIRR